jgi:hypothetical protein
MTGKDITFFFTVCLLFHADATHPNIVAFDGACDQRRAACVLLQPMS